MIIKISSFLLITLLGIIANTLNIEMFFGVNMIFGSIFVFLNIWLYGTLWGVVSALLINYGTIELWGHPYAYINFIFEALIVGLILKHTSIKNLIIADIIFWAIFGIWNILFSYGYIMDMDTQQVLLIALKQPINALLSVTIAIMIIIFFLQKVKGQTIKLREVLFVLMTSLSLFSVYATSMFTTSNSFEEYRRELIDKINGFTIHLKTEIYRQNLEAKVNATLINFLSSQAFENHKNIYILENEKVLYSTDNSMSIHKDLLYEDITRGVRQYIDEDVYHLLPEGEMATMLKWKNSFHIHEFQPWRDSNLRIVVKYPFNNYLDKLQYIYVESFSLLIVIMFIATLVSYIVSVHLIGAIEQLKKASVGLPEKILHNRRLYWGYSYIEEIEDLKNNIKEVANRLRTVFEESEHRYRELFERTQDALIVVDTTLFTIINMNYKAEDMLQNSREELLHHRLSRVIPHLTEEDLLNISKTEERIFFLVNRGRTPIKLNITPFIIKDREVWLISLKDWSAQIDAEKSQKLISTVFETTSEGIVITNEDTEIVMANRGFERITGYSLQEVRGEKVSILHSHWQSKQFYRDMWRSINYNGYWEGEIWNKRKSGDIFAEWLTIYRVKDGFDGHINYIATFVDITEKKRSQDRINRLAFYDTLTSMPNRTLFKDRFTNIISKAENENKRVSLLYLDIDNFKNINDTLGHQVGDLLIKKLANRISANIGKGDTVARLGGDEFTIVIEDIKDNIDIANSAENILQAINKPFEINKEQLYTSASIGICIYPDDAKDFDSLMKCADIAMYRAKESGKHSYEFFTEDINRETQERISIENGLREAIAKKEFELYYQPQVNSGGQIVGVEALIRWFSSTGRPIRPDIFIPIAESSGQIGAIEKWVIDTASDTLSRWKEMGINVLMSINISNHQFKQDNFVDVIKDIICKKDGVECEDFDLELTERIVSNDDDKTVEKLNELKKLNFHLSLDDFGTGQSSLSYLQKFNIDKLKIDKSFVDGVPENSQNSTIIDAIVSLSGAFGMDVIAEGVETEKQLEFLKSKNCCLYQGYYFSRPVPADEFEKLFLEQKYSNMEKS